VLPNKPWRVSGSVSRGDGEPDPDRLRRLMAERGIDLVVVDPWPPPGNPWGRGHPFFAGLDVLRGIFVLLRYRSAALVVSVFESGALIPLLLRRVLLFRPPIALWDVGIGSPWRARQVVLRFVLPRIDRVLLLSRWQKSATEQAYRLRHPAEVIFYAVDEQFYRPMADNGLPCIVSVGDDLSRDYATLIEAVENVPVPVVIRSAGVPDCRAGPVSIIQERISGADLRRLYASATIVVIPL
jgi:hypothetical protein